MMSKGKSKSRNIWLFNDMVVYGRPSWLAPGFYRHKGSVTVSRFGSAFEYGPFAFFVENAAKHREVFLPKDERVRAWWFQRLEGCPDAVRERSAAEIKASIATQRQALPVEAAVAKPAPPPPPPKAAAKPSLPAGWVELFDEANQRAYYYNEAEGVTQWDRPE